MPRTSNMAVCAAASMAVAVVLVAPSAVQAHTWLFTSGRATMQASLAKPFRLRVDEAGQGTHAQIGPGQSTVIRWASSHNNTFSLARQAHIRNQNGAPSGFELCFCYRIPAPSVLDYPTKTRLES